MHTVPNPRGESRFGEAPRPENAREYHEVHSRALHSIREEALPEIENHRLKNDEASSGVGVAVRGDVHAPEMSTHVNRADKTLELDAMRVEDQQQIEGTVGPKRTDMVSREGEVNVRDADIDENMREPLR